ncbi:hypothetical protein [Streptomyces griseus]|uniref:hypothetical protein n=1 Tax=Streptomyces griseus TaxID=1911 RepID=UPI001F449808|nr:hypothetical protein [Streptomyces griseus]
MSTDYWVVLGDSEREQWRYVPFRTIGPLDFGMSREDVVAAMARQGFTAEQHNMGGWHSTGRTQWRVEFSKPQPQPWRSRPAVKCYFVEGAGLTCVLVDGRLGPQVTHEGIRLIGRIPSELLEEMESYSDRHGVGLRSTGGGELIADGFEIDLGAQRAGDAVVTWALFCNPGEIAGTSWDVAPAEVWHHW